MQTIDCKILQLHNEKYDLRKLFQAEKVAKV